MDALLPKHTPANRPGPVAALAAGGPPLLGLAHASRLAQASRTQPRSQR